jgi:hypothetical protein
MFFWKRTTENTSSKKTTSAPRYNHKFVEDDFVQLIENNDPLQNSCIITDTIIQSPSTISSSNIPSVVTTASSSPCVSESFAKENPPTKLSPMTIAETVDTENWASIEFVGEGPAQSTSSPHVPIPRTFNLSSSSVSSSFQHQDNRPSKYFDERKHKIAFFSFLIAVVFLSILIRSSTALNFVERIVWAVVLFLILIVSPFVIARLKFGPKISMFIAMVLGYLLKRCDFSHWWILTFGGILVVVALLEEYQKKESTSSVRSGREWVNTLAKIFLSYVTNMAVEEFDIGDTLPSFKELSFSKKSQDNCEMTLAYNYSANENTQLKLWIPIPIPGYGTTNIPVAVSGPQISGQFHLECRVENCNITYMTPEKEKVTRNEKFLALAVAFDPIDNIHIGAIKVLMAPKWEWLQKLNKVKREMRQLLSTLLATDSVTIHMFDQKLNYIGSVTRKRMKNSEDPSSGKISDWTIQEIVSEMKTCYKCGRKYFADGAGCCVCIVDDISPRSASSRWSLKLTCNTEEIDKTTQHVAVSVGQSKREFSESMNTAQ